MINHLSTNVVEGIADINDKLDDMARRLDKPTTSREYNCYAYALGETEWKFVGGREGAVQDFSVENVAQMVLDDAKADGRAMRIIP